MIQLWNYLLALLSTTALLIPIGVLGVFRWAMWLAKRIPALFYRPIVNGYTTSATIITPVYNEDPVLFRRALDSWIANGPDQIIAVVDVTDIRCMEIARGYPGIKVIPIDIPGKRPALAAGVDASATDIVVLVDSDVIWEPDVLAKLKMPFADPAIGGVGTRQHMYPTDGVTPTLWERLADIYLDIRYSDEVPATTRWGRAVSCLSGRTAAYRTRLLQSRINRGSKGRADARYPALSCTFHTKRIQRARRIFADQYFDVRHFVTCRHQIVGKARSKRLPLSVVDKLFKQGSADALRYAACDLSMDQHRIDGPSHIIGHQISFDADAARQRIDLNLHEMNTVRIGHVVGLEPTFAFQSACLVKVTGDFSEAYRSAAFLSTDRTVDQTKLVRCGLQKIGGDFDGAIAQSLGSNLHGGARHYRNT